MTSTVSGSAVLGIIRSGRGPQVVKDVRTGDSSVVYVCVLRCGGRLRSDVASRVAGPCITAFNM